MQLPMLRLRVRSLLAVRKCSLENSTIAGSWVSQSPQASAAKLLLWLHLARVSVSNFTDSAIAQADAQKAVESVKSAAPEAPKLPSGIPIPGLPSKVEMFVLK